MRKALIGGAVFAAFAFAAPASAGCWATVQLPPPPAGTAAGDIWMARFTVFQHGRNPLPDARTARPKIMIVNRATKTRKTFVAKVTDASRGRYAARVVFPSGGMWAYRVWDGFTTVNGDKVPCARWHTYGAVRILRAQR